MGTEYTMTIEGHPSIYHASPAERRLQVYFHEPAEGMNSDTGLVLLISNYGELGNSPFYLQARSELADKHNLVVVQCDYFGFEFMQESRNAQYNINLELLRNRFTEAEIRFIFEDGTLNMSRFYEIGQHYSIRLEGTESLQESPENCNDMGIMQAIDQLSAIYAVNAILADNDYKINKSRIYVYGQGHAAYLAYLCNALAPQLFSCLIDNSGWLFPQYLESPRFLNGSIGKLTFVVRFEYLLKQLSLDREFLHLPSLYKQFTNHAQVVSFQGSKDTFVQAQHKLAFLQSVPRSNCSLVTEERVDNIIFRSAFSGLGAEYLALFTQAIKEHQIGENKEEPFSSAVTYIETKSYRYIIDFSTGMPALSRTVKTRPRLD